MASIRYVVTDIDSSVEFYRDKLECSVDMHNPSKFAALIRDDLSLYLSAPGAGKSARRELVAPDFWRSIG